MSSVIYFRHNDMQDCVIKLGKWYRTAVAEAHAEGLAEARGVIAEALRKPSRTWGLPSRFKRNKRHSSYVLRKGLTLQSYCGDGIRTINPTNFREGSGSLGKFINFTKYFFQLDASITTDRQDVNSRCWKSGMIIGEHRDKCTEWF